MHGASADGSSLRMNKTTLPRSLSLFALALSCGCTAATEPSDGPTGTTEDPLAVTDDGWASPHRGGTGGGAFQWDKCAPDEVVVGITQNRGQYVNTVGITCAKLAPNGSLGPDVPHYARGGRTDGQFFTMHCPAGSAVTGLWGYSHTYLDVLAIRCDAAPFIGHSVTYQNVGVGGGDWFDDPCPNGYVLHNLGLNWGNWIDGEQAVCAFVDPTLPRPSPWNVVFHAP